MKAVQIYTDGSCLSNPGGRSAYAAVILVDGLEIKTYGGYHSSTSNRMEVMAVVRALEQLIEPCDVTVYSDSKYVVSSINGWISHWKKSNFKGRANVDLLTRLVDASEQHKVQAVWVKSHNGNHYNEMCDQICTDIVSGKIAVGWKHDYFYLWFMSKNEK